jgi:hypothetical protein
MRRRLPSPALVIGCIALFAALGGAGYAAVLTLSPVQAIKPTVYAAGRIGTNAAVEAGVGVKAGHPDLGSYTLTISGEPFRRASAPALMTVSPLTPPTGKATAPPPTLCNLISSQIQTTGIVTAGVRCYALSSGTWKPADAEFDFALSGPKSGS